MSSRGNPFYVSLPEYKVPDNALLAKPLGELSSMFKGWREEDMKAQELDQRKEMNQLQKDRFQFDKDKYGEDQQQKQITSLAGQAQLIDQMRPDDPNRAGAWQKLVNSHPNFSTALAKYGIDPSDAVNGPKFLVAQAQGPRDEMKDNLTRAQIGASQAQADYQRAHARTEGMRGDALKQDSDTRRLIAVVDRFGDRVPSQAEWSDANQPGGVIHAAFGGRMIPYEQAPVILAQARRANNQPSPEELKASGFSDEQIKEMQFQNSIIRTYGKPKVGHIWARDDAGGVYQKKVSENDERGTLPAQQIEQQMTNITQAFSVIAGEVKPDGKLKGNGSWLPQRLGSQVPVIGPAVFPATAEAYMAADHAALQLSYALSGKQIGQQEQGRILNYFSPKPTDPNEIAAFKMNAARELFQRLLEAKRRGVTDEARAKMFDSELNRVSSEILKRQAKTGNPDAGLSKEQARQRALDNASRVNSGQPQVKPGQEPPRPPDPALKNLSNDELIRMLNE